MGDINFKAKMTNNTIFKMLLLKGEAGNNIESIAKTATSGVVDTYTITLTDGTTTTFTVTNGSNISLIAKTATSVLTDTYTVTLTSGETSTFEVTNGRGITSIDITDSDNYVDTYTITYNDGTTSTFTVTNGQDYTIPTGAIVAIDDSLPTPDGYEEATNPFSFDTTPTSGSSNGVTSGGVYDALEDKLDKAGGTMTGGLEINNGNMALTRTNNHAGITLGNASAASYFGFVTMYRNGNYVRLSPNPLTGNRTLAMPDASGIIALKSDIITPSSGYVTDDTSVSTSLTSGSSATVHTITVPTAGVWLILGNAYIGETSTSRGVGERWFYLSADETSVPSNRVEMPASPTSATSMKISNLFRANANSTFYLRVRQDSGETLTCSYNGMRAVKLMDL